MYLFLTSVGEKTTELSKWQAERLGFEVVLLDEKEPWIDKYKKFISMANDDCIRCDADIILNKNIKEVRFCKEDMIQYRIYDLYRNNIGIGQPVYYSKKALDFLKKNLDIIRPDRPETSAWRYIEQKGYLVYTDKTIVGMHGFFQDKETIERAKLNKINRKQIDLYDFELVDKIMEVL